MVSKRTIKLSLLLPFALLGAGVLAIMLYLLVPLMLSSLTGQDDACGFSSGGQASVGDALSSLCGSLQVLLGGGAMILIVLSAASGIISMIAVTVDILRSDMEDSNKLIWLLAMWLAGGYLVALVYYFMIKRGEGIISG